MVATNQKTLPLTENAIREVRPTAAKADLATVGLTPTPLPDKTGNGHSRLEQALGQTVDLERSILQLPSDFLKTPTTTYQPKYWAFTLPPSLIESLQVQAQQEDIDERSLLLAAFTALLYRYTQQETIDLELTMPMGVAHGPGTTAMRTQLQSELTVRALISQISMALNNLQRALAAPSVQAPSEQPSNDRAALPIAVTFVEDFFRVEGKELRSEFQSQSSLAADHYDLHLIILQQKGSFSGVLQYNASLFQVETIQRLAGHLQMLLQSSVNDRDCSIAQLPLLTEAETQQLAAWQSASIPYPQTPIHQLIEAHVVQQPTAIALTFKDQRLTYAALNQRANQLAHYLIHIGVGAGVRVAVCVEPSLDIAVCLLAIFKAGGVYLPLDPTHPIERLTTILEETQPRALLTQSHLLPRLPAIAHNLCLDAWSRLHPFPMHNPNVEVRLEQTSHLVYTSGTTGKPKGVMTSYGNLVNYILAAQERFGFDCHTVMPAIARFTFSITMFELLSPLVAGGTLMILEREHILDFKRMVQTLQQSTVIHTSPSLLQKLLAYIQEHDVDLQTFQGLKHVSTGGDMVPAALLETMKRVFQTAEIYVIYGCSEVSCMGCSYPILSDRPVKSRVGKPFTNVAVRLYDSHQNRVPIGIPGEIYIGGAGVTQGYWQREALTQEKFVTIDGCRFYRTGDVGRLDADGNLEMLGRADFQIKLRGIRIELGEIEATLRQAPGVREGIVMACQLGHGEKSLVAYVVLDPAQTPPIANIRSLLQEKLPDYMIPAAFVVLDAMPVNLNQKVDRRALPLPTPANMAGFKAFVAPRDAWEQQLTAIWETVLGVQPIGIQTNFFELGGDSLKAVQILTQIEQQFGKSLPITAPFQAPTIEALANLLRSDEAEAGGSDLVPLRRSGTKPPLFCLYGVLLYRELVDQLDDDQPVYGVYLQEEVELLKTGKLAAQNAHFFTVPGIAARYLKAIRTLQPHGPYYLAGESFGGVIAFEMAKQLQAAGETIALVALFDSLAPHTRTQKPLAQKLKLHWQLLAKQGLSYALELVQPQIQTLTTQLHALYQRLAPGSTMPERDNTAGDIRREARQQASDSYFPCPYTGELLLFRAMERDAFEACDRDMGWTSLAAGGLQIFDVPGDHLSILKAPNVQVMATQLQSRLRAS